MPDQILAALDQVLLRLRDGHPGESLELGELALLRVFQLLMELLRALLAVRQPLLAARDLRQPLLDVFLLRLRALLDPRELAAPLLDFRLDPGA